MDANPSAFQRDNSAAAPERQSSTRQAAPFFTEQMKARDHGVRSICHLIASREHGEMERHVADLSRWQALNTNTKIAVIAHQRYRNTLDERVTFIPLNTDRSRHHPTLTWRLANHIRAGEFQIAHGHGSKSAQLLAAVQTYTEAQQVITRHNVRHPRDKLASAFAARIAVSHSAVANSRLNWNIIPNGIDTPTTDTVPVDIDLGSAPSVLVAARLLRLRGLDVLMEALAKLPGTQLIVLGDGPGKNDLEKLARKLNLSSRVNLIGYTDKVGAFMRAADLLLMPSQNEAPPCALIEALLNRCPVLSGRSGNAEEYIPSGYLLDRLEPAYLAEKLDYALQDRNRLRLDFKPVFDRAASELTLERMAHSTWQIYTQLLS